MCLRLFMEDSHVDRSYAICFFFGALSAQVLAPGMTNPSLLHRPPRQPAPVLMRPPQMPPVRVRVRPRAPSPYMTNS